MTETVMSEIEAALMRVGESDVRRVQRVLPAVQPDDKPLGTIHDEELKRMYALAHLYDHDSDQALLDSTAKADSLEEAAELHQKAHRSQGLAKICQLLFWTGARDAIGLGTWPSGNITLRENWMLVAAPKRENPFEMLIAEIARPKE